MLQATVQATNTTMILIALIKLTYQMSCLAQVSFNDRHVRRLPTEAVHELIAPAFVLAV